MKPRTLATLSLGLAALLLVTPFAAAQEPQAEFGEDVLVSEVLLDVLVTDRQGNVIVGLTPDDFSVAEDGEPVEITDVTFYSNRQLLESAAALRDADIAQERQNRYFILFFQEQQRANSDQPGLGLLQQQMLAAREARRWVEEEKLLDDFVAVVSYDAKLKVHQDFTQDDGELIRAINDAVTGKDPGANWPSRIPGDAVLSLRANLPRGQALRDETPTIYEALSVLAKATGPIVGRKNLVFFTTGFGQVSSFGLYRPDPRYFPDTVQALNDNNVAVYAVDLVPNTVEYELADGLNQIAEETGGQYYFNFTNFITPLKQVASENSGYYLLSYRSTHPVGSAGFQKVDVSTKNREFRVRAREGYLYGEGGAG